MTTTAAPAPLIVTSADAGLLGRSVAARFIVTVVDAQAARGFASVVLTGGGIGTATLRELASAPARDAVDWSKLDVWWGDERWLPSGDGERNETQARAALLDAVPIDPARIHPMAASDGPFADADLAAAAYSDELAQAATAGDPGGVPQFDLLMLGIGPEGHVASLFPDAPGITDQRTVVGVHGSPKPPPTRISLTFAAICSAREVWIVAAGEEKAEAVRASVEGAKPSDVPAAGARGTAATRYLLDRAAASRL